jgi:hypothetical protein
MSGGFYDSFAVNSENCTVQSRWTDAFIAEFDRLLARCVGDAHAGRPPMVREPFELLFGVLRHIDEAHDDVIFFADEGSSREVAVDWRTALPAYFCCLAETTSAAELAQSVYQTILDFDEHDRAHHLRAASRVANAEQKAALGALMQAPPVSAPARD